MYDLKGVKNRNLVAFLYVKLFVKTSVNGKNSKFQKQKTAQSRNSLMNSHKMWYTIKASVSLRLIWLPKKKVATPFNFYFESDVLMLLTSDTIKFSV